jgi:hypothetical protein
MINIKEYMRSYRKKNKDRLRNKERERIRNLTGEKKELFLIRQRRNDKLLYERGKEIINKAKDVPCKDCGKKYPFYVMDFDHVRGKKSFGIGSNVRCRVGILLKEIEKCEVVCANCHRIRTYKHHA